MMRAMKHAIALAACSFAPSATGEMQLLPAGKFSARDGRPHDAECWLINSAIAKQLIADIDALKNPLVVDYEHQTMLAADNGQPAPAAGWFKSVRWEEGVGLFAEVEWTERAIAHIDAGEYKYISPVIAYDKATGAIKKIINAALTNSPAIDGMEAVTARLTAELYPQETLTMDIDELLERVRYLLNLPTLATPEEVAAELQKAVDLIKAGENDAVAANTLGIVGLTTARTAEVVALKAEMETATAALKAAQDELSSIKTAALAQEVDGLITAALTEHKIAPAQKDAMVELGKKDLALLKSILSAAVPVVAVGQVAAPSAETVAAANFTAPQGFTADGVALEKLGKAHAYMQANDVTLETALKAMEG